MIKYLKEQAQTKKPFHNQIWALIEDHKEVSLRVIPAKVNVEAVGFDGVFFNHLRSGRIAMFEPDYLTEFIKDVYCRKVTDIKWHMSPPIDVSPIRFAFGFSKHLAQDKIKRINLM
jgi:hypothetical protein